MFICTALQMLMDYGGKTEGSIFYMQTVSNSWTFNASFAVGYSV
jgi:hypothetical protein